MAGAVISRGMMLCATVLVARMMGKSVYGELGMIRSTVGMLGVFAGYGLGLTATKYVAEFRRNDTQRAGRIIALSSIVASIVGAAMAVALCFSATWLAEHTINAPHLAGMLRIGGIIVLINAMNGAQTGALAGFEAFKTIAYVNLVVGLISFPVMLVGVYFGGLKGAVWALAINLGVNWLLNHIALRRESRHHGVPLTLNHCWDELPILWKFSLPSLLASIVFTIATWGAQALLARQIGGYEELGVYTAAFQWFSVLIFLPGLLSAVLLPILSDHLGEVSKTQSVKTTLLAIRINATIVLPIVFLGSLFSPIIMGLYGDTFVGEWATLIAVLCTAGLLALQQPVSQVLHASGYMWIAFTMNCAWALTLLTTAFFLTPLGSFGLALAGTISQAVHSIWTFGFVMWLYRTRSANE